MKDLEDLHSRAREFLRDARKLVERAEQLEHDAANLREPADECSVLEQAAEIAERHKYYAYEADIRSLLVKVRATNMLAGMRDATARKEGANA